MARVLLVDDEATVRRVMELGLSKAGHVVRTAENGQTALEAARTEAPDLLITDIEMPRMDGRQLCETIRAQLPEPFFPIFVLTSLTEREHRSWAKGIAGLEFLEKPVSMRTLLRKISETLAGSTSKPNTA